MDCIQLLCLETEEDSAPSNGTGRLKRADKRISSTSGRFVFLLSHTFSLNRCKKYHYRGDLVAGKGLMNGRLEAAHVFHGCALSISRLQILVQNSNYFIIQNLELANSFNHFLQRHVLYNLIFAIVLLDFQEMVAEIQHVKATLLSQEHNDHAASPVQAISKALLHSELVRSHGDAVDELHRAPEAVEFYTLVHVHHSIAG